jgi:hypothetical protein
MELRSYAAMADNALAFYRGALWGLKYVEARRPTGRRFGADADALWKGFAGDLSPADRLDLLIRDADAEWPGAFGARTVFDRKAVAEEEPFGVGWEGLDGPRAAELWRDLVREPTPDDAWALLEAVASGWDVRLQSFDLGTVAPADRLVVVGPSAIAATAAYFAGGRDLDWAEQVVCVATPPEHRQLAALARAVVNTPKRALLLSAAAPGLAQAIRHHRVVASADAHADDRAAVGGGN